MTERCLNLYTEIHPLLKKHNRINSRSFLTRIFKVLKVPLLKALAESVTKNTS